MPRTATLTVDGKTITFPIVESAIGEAGIDISKLRDQTGLLAFDPAFGNTASCSSTITYIDGDKGILRYRGIPIEQFAGTPNFLESAWLLIFGRLPTAVELDRFSRRIAANAMLHESMRHHFNGFPTSAPPMAIASAMINTLSCFEPDMLQLGSDDQLEEAAARLISKARTIAAYTYRSARGLPIVYPDPKLGYCANLLHMMFSMPYDQYVLDPAIEEALNLIFLLHADHEQNCSTSTVRVVGSSKANLFASCAAGVCALWGPLHGGANVEVIEQLTEIHQGGMSPEDLIAQVKQKKRALMGFGHRVYKNFDPRAKMLQAVADKVFTKLNRRDPLLDIARRLEEAALKDSYFVDRKLYPNVDFYSGILFRAIGIPTDMFTVMFTIGRLPGWIAQWKEQRDTPGGRIARPRQVYTGVAERPYVPVAQR
jgi:citrate synthase